jgi:hypothetical protein
MNEELYEYDRNLGQMIQMRNQFLKELMMKVLMEDLN